MLAALLTLTGCITDVPEPRPETSKEMIRELPATPPPTPVSAAPPVDGARPTEVTMHQVRGTPAGTRVVVNGFLVGSDETRVNISADSRGKTLQLRCEGPGGASLGGAAPQTAVRVVGNVSAPDDELVVLTDCTAVPENALGGDARM